MRTEQLWRSIPNCNDSMRHPSGFVLRPAFINPATGCCGYALYSPPDDGLLHGGLVGYVGDPYVATRMLIRACRAVRKRMATDDRLAAQIEGAEADRKFDGGEWSDAHHAEVIAGIQDAIIAGVARRYGLSADGLGRMFDWYLNFEMAMTMDAMRIDANTRYNAGYAYAAGYHD